MSAAGAAFPIEDASQVAAARRAAQGLAERLGYSESRAGQVALIVTELGTNLAKHARGGQLLLRATEDAEAIEILALDRGPGIPNVTLSQQDGFSTRGTPGEGLGAIKRQADDFQIYTAPSGTAALARIARESVTPSPRQPRLEVGAIRVNAPGEQVCGDNWSVFQRDERLVVLVVDGLGHGLSAHDAANAAVAAFQRVRERGAAEIIQEVHGALRSTRGAAVAVLVGDLERQSVRYCGLGNIFGSILVPAADGRHQLVSHNGTAGHGTPRIQEFHYPYPADAILVMHSDGIGRQWDLGAYPGVRVRHPSFIAGLLFRDFARGSDDATVVVVKARRRA